MAEAFRSEATDAVCSSAATSDADRPATIGSAYTSCSTDAIAEAAVLDFTWRSIHRVEQEILRDLAPEDSCSVDVKSCTRTPTVSSFWNEEVTVECDRRASSALSGQSDESFPRLEAHQDIDTLSDVEEALAIATWRGVLTTLEATIPESGTASAPESEPDGARIPLDIESLLAPSVSGEVAAQAIGDLDLIDGSSLTGDVEAIGDSDVLDSSSIVAEAVGEQELPEGDAAASEALTDVEADLAATAELAAMDGEAPATEATSEGEVETEVTADAEQIRPASPIAELEDEPAGEETDEGHIPDSAALPDADGDPDAACAPEVGEPQSPDAETEEADTTGDAISRLAAASADGSLTAKLMIARLASASADGSLAAKVAAARGGSVAQAPDVIFEEETLAGDCEAGLGHTLSPTSKAPSEADRSTAASALTTPKIREQQQTWIARVFTTLHEEELQEPGFSARISYKRLGGFQRFYPFALPSRVAPSQSMSRSASAAAIGAPSASQPLSRASTRLQSFRTFASVQSPPSPPAPSSCDAGEYELGSQLAQSRRLLRPNGSTMGDSTLDEDAMSTGTSCSPMVPACGSRRTTTPNSRVASAARRHRSAVPGLDMSRVRMNYDDDLEGTGDASEAIGLNSDTTQIGAAAASSPPEHVPRLDLSVAILEPSPTLSTPLDASASAWELDTAKELLRRTVSESSIGATVHRPVNRGGAQELGRSHGSPAGIKKMPDFWIGQPERRRTVGDAEDTTRQGFMGFDEKRPASSAADIRSVAASRQWAELLPSPPPAAQPFAPSESGVPTAISSAFHGPGLPASPGAKVRFAGVTDPRGTILVGRGKGKKSLTEAATVRLPPVGKRRGGQKSPSKGAHLAKQVAVKVHMHSHYHHHYHVRGKPIVSSLSSSVSSGGFEAHSATARLDAFGSFAEGDAAAIA